jgi:hypothetical protein
MSTSINPLTNKVGNIILIIKINIMKVTLLLNDYNKQETLISDNMTHTSHEDTMSGNSS